MSGKKERKTDATDNIQTAGFTVASLDGLHYHLARLLCCDGEVDGWPGRVGVVTAVDWKEC